jgi:hypothetical protein
MLEKYKKVECRYELTQTLESIHGNNTEIMEKISKELELSLKNIIRKKGLKQIRIRSLSLKSNLNIVQYFTLFPLQSTKYNNYLD